ncbi:MAG: extracellular solute-binding protein [Lachnospiraceae bacterium]|nr:extracellular solute-binding protein [Lachnospiraceae bacterium]
MKKTLALILSAGLIFQLAGCGSTEVAEDASVAEGAVESTDSEETTLAMEYVTDENGETVTDEAGNPLMQEVKDDQEDVNLNFWYTDSNMTEYFTKCVEQFEAEHPHIQVTLSLVATSGYLENIDLQSVHQINAVDVYMLNNSDLEQAYLAGLAQPYDADVDVFTEANYGKSAMRAVTYYGKQIAYPLYFDSAFLVYNTNYVTQVPQTFDDILIFSSQEVEEDSILNNMEKTMTWDVSNYKFNYVFLSDYFVMGGVSGDDRSYIDTNNDNVIAALTYYQALYDFFAIDRKELDKNGALTEFMEGKTAFTMARIGDLPTLDEGKSTHENFDYGTAAMPDLTENLPASSISYTQCLVVDPFSVHRKEAGEFVKAVCYDYVADFYGMTGFLPSRNNWNYSNPLYAGIYANYSDSTPVPKFFTLGDYYIELEILLHKVWDQDGEITDLVNEFQDYITNQIK